MRGDVWRRVFDGVEFRFGRRAREFCEVVFGIMCALVFVVAVLFAAFAAIVTVAFFPWLIVMGVAGVLGAAAYMMVVGYREGGG